MINKSFQLIRTNPLLTTNFKVVVTSDYSIYLESFNTNPELNNVKYKHYNIYKNEFLENKIPSFYKQLPVDIAYDVKYNNDNNVTQGNYENQFDTIYFTGAGYVEDQWYSEEFDYFAPLYIRKSSLPKGFVILRVDEPSGYNISANDNYYEFETLNKDNFSGIVENWKCIKYFDMTYSSDFGQWLYKNYVNNDRFPIMSFEYNPERSEFSNWYGMDYTTGIYTSRALFMEDRNEIETPHYRFEKFITEGYKKNNLIFPYILNLKFLFDDTPATPTSLRKYSMNRYYGFYIDELEFVGSLTSYVTPTMRTDTQLLNNIIILSGTTGITEDYCNLDLIYDIQSVNPFVQDWDDSKDYYIFIDNTNDFYRKKTISDLYQVKKVIIDGNIIYKVISDEILDNYWNPSYSNIKTVNITYNNYNIVSSDNNQFFIDKYITCSQQSGYTYGDLYLINMIDNFHVIKYSSGITWSEELNNKNILITDPITGDVDYYQYYIQTDYAINLNSSYLEYWIQGKNSNYYRKYNVESSGRKPLVFPIYRIKFSDVKDFDFDRVDTQYSDFDYEKTEYVDTVEEKLYAFDYNSNNIPPNKRVEPSGSAQYKISNVSSEYIADDELYEIYTIGQQSTISTTTGENKLYDLSDIWRKNKSIVKWGFMGSISHSDYPYKLNNNYEVGGIYNRTTDPFTSTPDVLSKNIDYFYRIGNFYNAVNQSSDYVYYKNQTTNIQNDFISSVIGNGFDVDAYFGNTGSTLTNNIAKFDYFTYFFKNKMYYENNSVLYTKSYDKYSVFNCGDDLNTSVTLFKGLKFKIRNVENIYQDPSTGKINKILYGNKSYNDYKLSVILNEKYNTSSSLINNSGYINTSTNSVNIILNEKHKNVLIIINSDMGLTSYLSGSSVRYDYLNDISIFNEKDGLYYGRRKDGTFLNNYNPSVLTASNFINAINDYTNDHGLSVRYYIIREIDNMLYHGFTLANNPSYTGSTMDTLPDWSYKFQPYMINIELPTLISLNNNCYSTIPYYINTVTNDYVATIINFDDSKSFKVPIYRYSGPYEPIFKDVNIFKGGYFCYNFYSSNLKSGYSYTTSTPAFCSNSILSNPNNTNWEQTNNMCSVLDNKYVQINVQPNISGFTNDLIVNGFNFNIPDDAIITGITVKIIRKSSIDPTDDLYVVDNEVKLTRNINNIYFSTGKTSSEITGRWSNSLETVYYPNSLSGPVLTGGTWGDYPITGITDAWYGSSLNVSDVNNENFGVYFSVFVVNTGHSSSFILPMIKCIEVIIEYKYQRTQYTNLSSIYFDNNIKFDTDLNDFGKIEEIIFSKVNEDVDIFKSSKNKYHIYPIIDEYGYEYTDRFVFKSPWDKEFFIRTNAYDSTQEQIIQIPTINLNAATVSIISTGTTSDQNTFCNINSFNIMLTSSGTTNVTEMGVCWSTSQNPTINDNKKVFSTSPIIGNNYCEQILNLNTGTTYYFRAYATNEAITSYSSQATVITLGPPLVLTVSPLNTIGYFDAILEGTLLSWGGYTGDKLGFYVYESGTTKPLIPSTFDPPSPITPINFTLLVNNLESGKTYEYSAYAKNNRTPYSNTDEGDTKNFTTNLYPILYSVVTKDFSGITQTSVVTGGDIFGPTITGLNIIQKGVHWRLTSTPPGTSTLLEPRTSDGTGTNSYISNIDGLSPGTKYWVWAYVEHSNGLVVYDVNSKSFTTLGSINCYISGKVTDKNQNALAGATITFTPTNGPIVTSTSDQYGNYVLTVIQGYTGSSVCTYDPPKWFDPQSINYTIPIMTNITTGNDFLEVG